MNVFDELDFICWLLPRAHCPCGLSDWDGACLTGSVVGVCHFVILSLVAELDVLVQSHFCLALFLHAGLDSLFQVVCFCSGLCPRASPGVLTFFGWLSGALSSGVYEC